jgi:PAS domain S-box-containing protein
VTNSGFPLDRLLPFARGRTVLLLHVVLMVGLIGSLLVAASHADATRGFAMVCAAFFAVALCVGAIVATNASALPSAETLQAMRIIERTPAYTWTASSDGRVTYVSASLFSYVGQSVEGSGLFHVMDKAGWRRIVHPDDYARVIERRRHCQRTGVPYDIEYRIRRRDGAYRWFRSFGSAPRDDHGRVVGWSGTMIDIEEQKQAEAALRDRQRELSQLVDMVPSHVWRLTPDGEPTFFNKRMVDFLGLDVADTDKPGVSRLASVIDAVIHPDDAEEFRDALSRSLVTGESFAMRYRLHRVDGAYRWMSSRAEPMRDHAGRIVHWYGLCHDIDDQVRAEQALRQSERQLRQMIDAVPALIWCTTPEGIPCYLNKRATDVTGVTLNDLIAPDGSRSLTVVHPDDRDATDKALARSFETGASFVGRYRQRRSNGPHRWVESRAEPLRDEAGVIVQWYGVSVDIDDEVAAQQALREREHQLTQLVDIVPALIWRLTPDGEPSYFNKRLIDYFGLDVADSDTPGVSRLAATIRTVVHPDDAAALTERLTRSLTTGESFSLRYRLRRHDGVYRWIEGRAEPMRNRDGEIVQWYGLCLDIEEEIHTQGALRAAQDKLARATQAASLSELSASIAHEVNQPLAAIVATSHACRRWLSADPPNLERAKITLERIVRDANSAADVVSRIRALFSQLGRTRLRADMTEVIVGVCRLMADELATKNIEMETDFGLDLPLALIDPVQMEQVLINLLRNAIDALDTIVDDTRLIRLRALLDGDNAIRIEVQDLGAGMKEPERAFEPFFTTKKNGMGMGLAICRSIIESHNGRLWAINNQPRGTTLAFTLPIQARDAA